MSHRILIFVEDNANLAEGRVEYNLRLEGYDVRVAETGRAALSFSELVAGARRTRSDAAGHRRLSGPENRSRTGKQGAGNKTVARGEESDKVRGFRLDADQYVTKPFGIVELLKVSPLCCGGRLSKTFPRRASFDFGDVVVDIPSRTVVRHGQSCTLTPKAYELLLALIRRDGAVGSRTDLLKEVWGYGAFVMTRTA